MYSHELKGTPPTAVKPILPLRLRRRDILRGETHSQNALGGRSRAISAFRRPLGWHIGPSLAIWAFLGAVSACANGPSDSFLQEEAPSYRGTVDLAIGELHGPEPFAFGRVSGLAQDPSGRIYVSDSQADEVRVFGPDGSSLFVFGGSGRGPGRLKNPCCLAFRSASQLWVREVGNGRYSAFSIDDSSAVFDSTVYHGAIAALAPAPLTFDPDGRIVSVVPARREGSNGFNYLRYHLAPAGESTRTDTVFGPEPSEVDLLVRQQTIRSGRTTVLLSIPYGAEFLHAHRPGGGWATAISSEYTVSIIIPGSEATKIRRPEATGPELSPDERLAVEGWAERTIGRGVASRRKVYSLLPSRKPPIRAMYFDQIGGLWVEESVPSGGERAATIHDPEGHVIRRVQWPSEVELGPLAWIGEYSALGISTDNLGVQRVTRLRFAPQYSGESPRAPAPGG